MFKNLSALVSAIFVIAATAGLAHGNDLVYASTHAYTPEKQPPRYWQIGVTSKPPPKGVHPEYAEGKPDGRLAGWAREKGSLILGFSCNQGLKNVDGPDLSIWHFGPGGARLYVSSQKKAPTLWHLLGDLPTVSDHAVKKTDFEFGKLNGVFYVKIEKWDSGMWGKGRFIDAIAGAAPCSN